MTLTDIHHTFITHMAAYDELGKTIGFLGKIVVRRNKISSGGQRTRPLVKVYSGINPQLEERVYKHIHRNGMRMYDLMIV